MLRWCIWCVDLTGPWGAKHYSGRLCERVFLDGINIWIYKLRKANWPPSDWDLAFSCLRIQNETWARSQWITLSTLLGCPACWLTLQILKVVSLHNPASQLLITNQSPPAPLSNYRLFPWGAPTNNSQQRALSHQILPVSAFATAW